MLHGMLSACLCGPAEVSAQLATSRPRLQFFNTAAAPVDVLWLPPTGAPVPNGRIAPGGSLIITTTLGHVFELAEPTSGKRVRVESVVPVQGYAFPADFPAPVVESGRVIPPPAGAGVPAFYTQFISAEGFPIVASAKVSPYALLEAAYLVNQMSVHRPDVRRAMIQSGARLCIMGHGEFTTDLPEFTHLKKPPGYEAVSDKDYWDARARGTGGSATDPYCSCAEENLLGLRGDPYAAECILIHEFAHNMHLRGLANVDPSFDGRVKAAYQKAMSQGLWRGKYASVNHHEYFAEGVQSWFDDNRENDHDHNHVNTRVELKAYDSGLAALCEEVFGPTVLKYTKPATRLVGHMQGYDPAKAPAFSWPKRLEAAKAIIREQAQKRGQAAAKPGSQTSLRQVEGWALHISPVLLEKESQATDKALMLLRQQLQEIIRVVPAPAVEKLRRVPLWFSPAYPGVQPRAEYHPSAAWLRDNKRDANMAKGVEFTNIAIFEQEVDRMPNFVLHELAHAFHDQVLGFDQSEIVAAYERAQKAGIYEKVERWSGSGKPRAFGRAYGLTNAKEYFAETTEAYFSRNDFFPFTRQELVKHDPEMAAVLARAWGVAE